MSFRLTAIMGLRLSRMEAALFLITYGTFLIVQFIGVDTIFP